MRSTVRSNAAVQPSNHFTAAPKTQLQRMFELLRAAVRILQGRLQGQKQVLKAAAAAAVVNANQLSER